MIQIEQNRYALTDQTSMSEVKTIFQAFNVASVNELCFIALKMRHTH